MADFSKFKPQTVELDVLGEKVKFRQISAAERMKVFAEFQATGDDTMAKARVCYALVAKCVVNGKGHPVYGAADEVAELTGTATDALTAAVMQANGMAGNAVEDAGKN